MGYIVAQDPFGYLSTWGYMRGAFFNSAYNEDNPNFPFPPNAGLGYPTTTHDRTYINDGDGLTLPPTWFTDGSGSLFRTYPGSNPGLWWGTIGTPPVLDGKLYFGTTVVVTGPMDNKDFEQFVGNDLTSDVDTIVLGADANTSGQTYSFNIDRSPGFITIEGMAVIT